ncbi:MAG: hypothetical protein EVG15_10810 [Candidatus Acididesulfobacter diazotrophicus]|jgi:hypothetical protein|uniref:Uncharacterized protein n=1 Tax=Candidatus Acididesulfobacter diazotrophicus TaxID=2597226 RepID=A0A519BJR7_9DELT|nr:MAG: hypothetical protein EVG15_10810 [Candidatus Acididesulfobacter diazotrophicus]
MKKIKFIDDNETGFNINNIKNNIFITSFGYSHVFNYPYILVKEIEKLSKKIDKDKIDVYFDLSSVLGKDASNKYFLITYDKNKKDFDYSSKKTVLELFKCDDDDESNNVDEESYLDKANYRMAIRKKRNSKISLNTNRVTNRILSHRKTQA